MDDMRETPAAMEHMVKRYTRSAHKFFEKWVNTLSL
jgi:hypothetical protein